MVLINRLNAKNIKEKDSPCYVWNHSDLEQVLWVKKVV